MQLFEHKADPKKNWLPQDGIVNYYGKLFDAADAARLLNLLMTNIQWQHDRSVIYGKTIETRRKVAWYAERAFSYRYSGTTKVALPWTREVLEIKKIAELYSGETFNSCLLNLYHTGEEGMAWHSDGEKELRKNGAIASLSFGAERKFSFKHKDTGRRIDLVLENGSLLVMKGVTQSYWVHRLPPTRMINQPRVNLTFRQMEQDSAAIFDVIK